MKKNISLLLVLVLAHVTLVDAHGGNFGGGNRGFSGSGHYAGGARGGRAGQYHGGAQHSGTKQGANGQHNRNHNYNHNYNHGYYHGGGYWAGGWGFAAGFFCMAFMVGTTQLMYGSGANRAPVYVVNNTFYDSPNTPDNQDGGVDKTQCATTEHGTFCKCSIKDKDGNKQDNAWCKKEDESAQNDTDDNGNDSEQDEDNE